MSVHEAAAGSVIYERKNEKDAALDVLYASITAPAVVRCEVRIDEDIVDVVYAGAGGSHSWWAQAGGKLIPIPNGLAPGKTLRILVSGPAAFRIDWYE